MKHISIFQFSKVDMVIIILTAKIKMYCYLWMARSVYVDKKYQIRIKQDVPVCLKHAKKKKKRISCRGSNLNF